jgi:aspartate aminotransferase-like enzyme
VRRNGETCIKQRRSNRDSHCAAGRAKPSEAASRRGRGDPGDDESVAQRALPKGPHRDDDDGERPEGVGEDREQASGEEREMVLRRRDPVRCEPAVHLHRERDTDGQADVEKSEGCCAAPAGEEKRARAEERRRQQGPGGVVDTERAAVPAGSLTPGDRGSRDGVGGQTGRPGQQLGSGGWKRQRRSRSRPAGVPGRLRRPAGTRPVPRRQQAREPEGEQGRGEGDEGVHAGRVERYGSSVTKRYLFTPGPTPVPPEVLAAVGAPVIHHRSPDFLPVYERVLSRLREVCRTESDVLLFGASGTGAFESAVANLVSPGEPHLVVSAGSFGERWVAMTTAFGADVDVLRYAWGETPDADDLRARLSEREARAVWLVHSETSTGVVADVRSLAAAASEAGALVVVDAVSSLGAVPCETDAWGLDVVVSGSQKALMSPPGLGLAAVSEAALAATGSSPRFYFDWERTRKAQATLDAPVTLPVSLVRGLDVALQMLLDEGLEAAFDRHLRLGRAARAGVKALGLELFSPDEDRSAVVTAVRAPAGIDSGDVIRGLRDRFGITIANGQGELKGKIFRLGHIGWFDVFDIATQIGAVELVLAELGADVEQGVAVTAALDAFSAKAASAGGGPSRT